MDTASWVPAAKGENQYDRARHGTQAMGKRSKISYAEAEEIRALKGKVTQAKLAERYGISRANISLIQLGKTHTNPFKGARPDSGKFSALIKEDGRYKYLGRYDTAEAASTAYWNRFNELRQRR